MSDRRSERECGGGRGVTQNPEGYRIRILRTNTKESVLRHRDEDLLAVAPNQEERRRARSNLLQLARHLAHRGHLLAVDFENDVPGHDAGILRPGCRDRRRSRRRLPSCREIKAAGELGCNRVQRHPESGGGRLLVVVRLAVATRATTLFRLEIQLVDRDGERLALVIAVDRQRCRGARLGSDDHRDEGVAVLHGLSVELGHHVARTRARPCRRARSD